MKQETTDYSINHFQTHLKANAGFEIQNEDEDKPKRIQASQYAAAFNALMQVSGISPEFWDGLHILLDKTKGFGPSVEVTFSNAEAGALLPGDKGVSRQTKAKRWARFWNGHNSKSTHYPGFEEEQKRVGKRIAYYIPGQAVKSTKFDQVKLYPSRCKSSLAQMIVDIENLAYGYRHKMRGGKKLTRQQRFLEAAMIVWNRLPDYDAPREVKSIKQEGRKTVRPPQNRRLNRFLKAAREMFQEEQAKGPEAADALRERLHAELEVIFADTDHGEAEEIDANIYPSWVNIFDENCENAEQIEEVSSQTMDNIVHSLTPEKVTFQYENSLSEEHEIPPEYAALGVISYSDDGRKGTLI